MRNVPAGDVQIPKCPHSSEITVVYIQNRLVLSHMLGGRGLPVMRGATLAILAGQLINEFL